MGRETLGLLSSLRPVVAVAEKFVGVELLSPASHGSTDARSGGGLFDGERVRMPNCRPVRFQAGA
jgi:hypothetical protein